MLETSIVGCGYHGTVVDSNVFHAFVPDILVIRKCYAISSKNKLLRSDFTGWYLISCNYRIDSIKNGLLLVSVSFFMGLRSSRH